MAALRLRLRAALFFEKYRHRSPIAAFDIHHSTEDAGLDMKVVFAA